ncbi:MAG: GNAT family N-acetyltransferase [Thermomicrobiales bacterium]|nr:GNAT family N-acetyltransferase [Thermomicrobiales bacterium]MCO5222890.1 GNAT family N-acetyltransferase [Thermomicrobiales bacterium]
MKPNVRIEALETPRLLLRAPELGDARALTDILQDQEIHRWTTAIPNPYTMEDARAFIESRADAVETNDAFVWAIALRDRGQVVGMMGLHDVNVDRGRAELGYWMAESARGKGYATEAAWRVLSWAFETAELDRIQATYFPGNEASASVMRKIGMQPEGLLRSYGVKDGRLIDLYLQSVLRSDTTWMSTVDQWASVDR